MARERSVRMSVTYMDKFVFKSPTTLAVSGPTKSGKSHFTRKLIKYRNELFSVAPFKVLYCYGTWQKAFDEFEGSVDFYQGIPADVDQINSDSRDKHMLLILDDMMNSISKNSKVEQLFTQGSHHNNVSVVFITQNIFYQTNRIRTINLNCSYIIVTKNARTKAQTADLGGQMMMRDVLVSAMEDMDREQYSYLLIDLSPHLTSNIRVKRNIFPGEVTIAYIK